MHVDNVSLEGSTEYILQLNNKFHFKKSTQRDQDATDKPWPIYCHPLQRIYQNCIIIVRWGNAYLYAIKGHFYFCHSWTWLFKCLNSIWSIAKFPYHTNSIFICKFRKTFCCEKKRRGVLPPILRACFWYRINRWKNISQE